MTRQEGGHGHWAWYANELRDHTGTTIARVTADVLIFQSHQLLIEHTAGRQRLRVRGTAPDGSCRTLYQTGLTTTRLVAECEDRRYRLEKAPPWRSERQIWNSDHQLVATAQATLSGRLAVWEGPAYAQTPDVDVVFMTYGCALADTPWLVRRMENYWQASR